MKVATIRRLYKQRAPNGQPIWVAMVYEARPRKKDRVWTWRKVETVNSMAWVGGYIPPDFRQEVLEWAHARGYYFGDNVKQNDPVPFGKLKLLAILLREKQLAAEEEEDGT